MQINKMLSESGKCSKGKKLGNGIERRRGGRREATSGRAVREGHSGEVGDGEQSPNDRRNGHKHLPPVASASVVLKIRGVRDGYRINVLFTVFTVLQYKCTVVQCRVACCFIKLKRLKTLTNNDHLLSP